MNNIVLPHGLTPAETHEVNDIAFELADGFTRALIEARGNKSPDGWYDGTPKNQTYAAPFAGAMRYLKLRGETLCGYRVVYLNDRFRFEEIH